MPQYLSPGVYVEEVSSGIQPIAGVSTSTAGFIGKVDNVTMPFLPGRPLDPQNPKPEDFYTVADDEIPQLITSWQAFKSMFGDIQAGNQVLAHAVYGFFNNGGTRCWITRVTADLSADNVGKALEGFEAIDEIAIIAVPGATDAAIQKKVYEHCEKLQDRFAILDAKQGADPKAEAISGQVGTSNYAALYYPWLKVYDPLSNNNDHLVPPSGHMAGIYARVDTERGVHKAPANEIVRGALDLEKRLSKADHDGLNLSGINVIRQFDVGGSKVIKVWGARTLGGDANGEWKYVNVRRLFLFLRESIDEGTQWVVFEPNAPDLWGKITRNITAFLTNVWRQGALFGATPQEAFYVRCDASTNPPEVRDLGQVVTEIGVAVVKPAEFVIFRISQWAGPGA